MPERDRVPFEHVMESIGSLAKVVGSSGVAAIVFALPTVIGGFGVFILGVVVNDAQVNASKASIGMFLTLFGTGLCILLLFLFTKLGLWDNLGLSKSSRNQPAQLSVLEKRVEALEQKHREQHVRNTA